MLKVHRSLLCIKYSFCAVHHHFLMDTRTWQRLLTYCKHHKKHYTSVYDHIFMGGGGERVVDGEGG